MCYHVYILIWLKMLTISGAYFGMHFSWSIKTLSEKTVNRVPNYRKVQATMGIWEANPPPLPQENVYFKRLLPMFARNSFMNQNIEKYNVQYVIQLYVSLQGVQKERVSTFRQENSSNVIRTVYGHCTWAAYFSSNMYTFNNTVQSVQSVDFWKLRPRPHISRYFWIRNVFFLDMASIHTRPANSAANPDVFESALQSGNKINVQQIQ